MEIKKSYKKNIAPFINLINVIIGMFGRRIVLMKSEKQIYIYMLVRI